MVGEPVLLQVGEDLLQRLLADLADAPRRQLHAFAVAADEARLLQHPRHVLELLQVAPRLFAQQPLDLVEVQVVQVAAPPDLLQLLLELVHVL